MTSMNYCRFLGLLAAASLACAAPITFTFSGTINGSVGGVGFTHAPFTFVQSSDTTLITIIPGFALTPFQSGASITIAGFGTGAVSTATAVFDLQGGPDAGFCIDLCNGEVFGFDPAFGTYDLRSAIGPISTTRPFVVDLSLVDLSLSSTLGDIVLRGDNPVAGGGFIPDLTFTATTTETPEPGTTSLLVGLGALFLFAGRRKSRKS